MTARPEVTHRKLHIGPAAADSPQGELKFLVMATDGLFDRLSNEAVVGLVGQRINQPYLMGAVLKEEIMEHVMGAGGGGGGFDGKRKMKKKDEEAETFWYGMDDNAATFLIRNSLGQSMTFVALAWAGDERDEADSSLVPLCSTQLEEIRKPMSDLCRSR